MKKKKYDKPALTYAEQLQLLKDRGLVVEDEKKALHILEYISYYRLSGYLYPFLDTPKEAHRFKEGASFESAFRLYCFDRELRHLIVKELDKIEVGVRGKIVYLLSHSKEDIFWQNDSQLFSEQQGWRTTLNYLKKEFDRSSEDFIKSFRQKYDKEHIPSWILAEVSSLGSISRLFENLKKDKDKREIADTFGVNVDTLESWLKSFTYVRNLCAHHSRLWNRIMGIQPRIPKKTKYTFLDRKKITNVKEFSKKLYSFLVIVIYMLNIIHPKHRFVSNLEALFDKYPEVDRAAMGYPSNWKDEELWQVK